MAHLALSTLTGVVGCGHHLRMEIEMEPTDYTSRQSDRIQQLSRMRKAELAAEYRQVLRSKGQALIFGGPVTKDEFINAILTEEQAA